ncbi:uncharacterized protein LOC107479099 [Arachis duranensis]|uniref:Uncharacterized protein LOC107479099 n=1 Tax=Arachis duranensis TaxID=130453 RepID=A0A6P4CNU0_ARADU|nr:uncharacterized protein LOC107479099 [Arachis duranensis]
MSITTVQTNGIINKEATLTKGETIIMVGKTIPTKNGGTTIIKEVGTMEGIKGGTTTTINNNDTNKPTIPTKSTILSKPTIPTSKPRKKLPNLLTTTPKGGINAITLRSRTKLQERSLEPPHQKEVTQEEDVVEVEEIEEKDEAHEVVKEEFNQPRDGVSKKNSVEMFKKVEVIIPLFDAIHQVPKYAKFLKDLCKNKERIHDLETIPLGSSISALMGAIPEKCGDRSPCLVTCTIDGVKFIDCMCDLSACVSIMPLSVYQVLKLPPLKRWAARFVLADKSIIYVVGIAEDVLVSIKRLVFSIDFHILEMPPNESERTSSFLLGRPFLRTSWFKLDVFSCTYSFEIDGRVVSFSLDKAMRHPPEDHSIFWCDLIDNIVAELDNDILD